MLMAAIFVAASDKDKKRPLCEGNACNNVGEQECNKNRITNCELELPLKCYHFGESCGKK